MLKNQLSAGHMDGLRPSVSYHSDETSSITKTIRNTDESVNFITFNQDASCIALGLNNGYKIFNCKPKFGKCYQFKKNESIGKIEMLYCTSLIAVVGLGEEVGSSPRKLKIINTKRQSTICELVFPSTILQVKLGKSRMIVLLEEQIYIYDVTTMKLLHTIETSPNGNGLCTLSADNCDGKNNSFLAYPSPPKTVTHDSLLVNGVNTNGGMNSVQNNIQSVSNTPNRIGDVIIFNTTTLQPISVIEAHKSVLAAITLSTDGTLLATASDKGTIVRVFSVLTGLKLFQFRRGTYPTKIFSLSFSFDNKYVLATSSSGTVHIFRLGEEESLENKHKRKRNSKKMKLNPEYETIAEEENEDDIQKDEDEDDIIHDDGDDSDAEDGDDDDDDESMEVISNKHRKLSQESNNSFTSFNSALSNDELNKDNKSEPLIDQNRLSVARLIRRSSQTLGRKAAQKMGDFLPTRFSSILEPTRNFASLKINSTNKDIISIAIINNEIQEDLVPQAYLNTKDNVAGSPKDVYLNNTAKDLLPLDLLHINVVTSEGYFYTYGLDPERGGDCILLHQYFLLD